MNNMDTAQASSRGSRGHSQSSERSLRRWIRTRNYWLLLLGGPTLLATLLWLAVAVCLRTWTTDWVNQHYSYMADRALAERDYGTARVACERVLQEQNTPASSAMFKLGLALRGLGQVNEASALVSSLAPLTGQGYPPAHLLLARSIMATSSDPSALRTAEIHLNRVLGAEPENAEALIMLGQIYSKMQRWELAKTYYQRAANTSPGVALQLAGIAQLRGQEEEMKTWAERAARYFEGQTKAKPRDVVSRLSMAEAIIMLGQYTNALTVLDVGINSIGHGAFRELASRVYVLWESKVTGQTPTALGTRLELIQRGLQYYPDNPELLGRLITFSHLEGAEGQKARANMQKVLAQGSAAPTLHVLLGVDAWQRNQIPEAREHFDAAFRLAPTIPIIVNNMALVLALGDKPDLPRALNMVNGLLDRFPDSPVYRDTRGQILAKMGKWREALTDLEAALGANKYSPRTHAALATIYENLGMKDLAAEHQLLANPAPARPQR